MYFSNCLVYHRINVQGEFYMSTDTEVSEKHIEIVNLIYEMMHDPAVFVQFANKMGKLLQDQASTTFLEEALVRSATLAQNVSSLPNVELSRDIGVLVLGLNQNGVVTHVPPISEAWLGAKFVGNNAGIGWISKSENQQNIAHVLDFDNHKHLPIHASLQEGIDNRTISNLVVLHQFDLSDNALRALKDLYGLTPAELMLCKDMAEMKSLRQSAEMKKVKLSTVKSQLKSVFLKTGIRSQAELIRLLTQISVASAIQNFSRMQNINFEPDWKNGLVSTQTLYLTTRYGTRLSYSKFGDSEGRKVLFFHHGLGSRLHTREMAEQAKEQKLCIYKFDRPGFGNSDVLPVMSIKCVGNVILDLISAISDQNSISAIGYGVGGKTLIDTLPHLQGRIDNVVLYSFRGGLNYESSTIMHKLTQLVWQKPTLAKHFLKIITANKSDEAMRRNLMKYYEDSSVDRTAISKMKLATERVEEIKLSLKQGGAGTAFDYQNLGRPSPDFTNLEGNTTIRAIFGEKDEFNFINDAKQHLNRLPNCSVFKSLGHGQLHPYNKFDTFLKSAFLEPSQCPWLLPVQL